MAQMRGAGQDSDTLYVCGGESCPGVDESVVALNDEAQIFLDLARSIHGQGRRLSPTGVEKLRAELRQRYGPRLGPDSTQLIDQLASLALHHPEAA